MSQPILRPAPVVAAAVLLIVVASEMLVAGIAGAVALLLNGRSADCGCCVGGVIGLDFLVAASFLSTAVSMLRGTLNEPLREGNVVTILGGMAGGLCFVTLICCGWGLVGGHIKPDWNWLSQDAGIVTAGLLLLWGNTAALLTAGVLLRKNADRYLAWRRALRRPPEDAEYDQDEGT
jgi:hypothetical protein